MKLKLPYWLVITDKVKVGDSRLCRIRINPKYEKHRGLLAHEETHVNQWYAVAIPLFFIGTLVGSLVSWDIAMWILMVGVVSKDLIYTFSRKARLMMEVSAYRNQMKVESQDGSELYAEYLASPLYDLKITKAEALKLLKED